MISERVLYKLIRHVFQKSNILCIQSFHKYEIGQSVYMKNRHLLFYFIYFFLLLIRARQIQRNMLQKSLAVAINFLRYLMKNIKSLPVCD
jgi:hypothetical protein